MDRGLQDAGGMMAGPWGMGSGMLVMLAMLLLLTGTAIVIVLLLRRAVAGSPAELVRAGALNRLEVPANVSLQRGNRPASDEFEGFLVIPDITGYTRFMQMSAFALAHAQYAVSALLSSIIESTEGVLITAKIEGDAVLLYGVKSDEGGQQVVSGPEVGGVVSALLKAFYQKRLELSRANSCLCSACRHVDRLELKTIVHSGKLLHYDLRGQNELSGLPVIVAHRLLKSGVGLDRYVLITDEASEDVTLPFETQPRRHVETYDGVGSVESTVHDFTVDSLLGQGIDGETPSKAMDAVRKLSEGLRALHGSPRSG